MNTTPVRDLISAGHLRVEDGNHGNDRPRRNEFTTSGIAFVRAADMTSGRIDFEGAGKISSTARTRIRKGVGEPGDVLLSHKGTVGRVAIAPMNAPDFVCSPQTTFWRSLNGEVLNQRYLQFALEGPDIQSQLKAIADSTDMAPYVSLTAQRSLRLNLHPIEEQRAIAEVLGALDDKIAANSRLVDTADQLATLMTRERLEGSSAPLHTLATVTMGTSPKGDTFNETGQGVPFFQGVRDFDVRFPRERIWTTNPIRMAKGGDILVSVRAPVGRVNLAPGDVCIGRGLAAVNSSTDQQFTLFHLLKQAGAVWQPYEAEGTVFGSINRKQLHDLEIPLIRESHRSTLEAKLRALESRIRTALWENESLAATRDALLPALMSGRLRVKDAERQIEEAV
ncbi:restriction endonuclease subunit S [Pseudactinotalea sp. Z1748]|uniref:restriction endonuclease subunit S n=1 Tax=Pseudactinotalea sp. Z1748 TaxID=3413027 RepID=UPI003C7ECCCE